MLSLCYTMSFVTTFPRHWWCSWWHCRCRSASPSPPAPRAWPGSSRRSSAASSRGAVGGSPLQVSGPAAGLTVVVAELVAQFGWKATCAITAAAGVLQILFGLSRIARAALAIAPDRGARDARRHRHHHRPAAGPRPARRRTAEQRLAQPDGAARPVARAALVRGARRRTGDRHHAALALRARRAARVPGALVAVVVATACRYLLRLDVDRIGLDESVVDAIGLPDAARRAAGRAIAIGRADRRPDRQRGEPAVGQRRRQDARRTADRLQPRTGRPGHGQRVLGHCWVACPSPASSSAAPTNVAAGAKTRASAALHGVWLLLFSVLLRRRRRDDPHGRAGRPAHRHRRPAGETARTSTWPAAPANC